MNRMATFLLLLAVSPAALAQVPPGANYDPAKHVNPVITYVLAKDFKPSNYQEAGESAGIQLMGLSKEVGTLQGVDLAVPAENVSRDLRLDSNAKFYPVVRQTFKLLEGGEMELYSLKAPKVADSQMARLSVGGIPRGRRDPKDKRLGTAGAPEETEIRGRKGAIFDKDGALTLVWEEQGVIYTATSTLPRKRLLNIVDDLL
jgi:hypothetical protein